jgi:hypothetical protein
VPEHLSDLLGLSEIGRIRPEAWKPGKIEDREINGLSVRCLETNPDPRGAGSALCFDKSSGAIAVEVNPLVMNGQIVDKTCFFSDYQKFGNRVLARSYECAEDKHPRLQARIVELVAEPAPDPALFAPLDGAKESVNCLGPVKHPTVVHEQDPSPPRTSDDPILVVIRMAVGIDGKPLNLRVASAPNHDFDQAALEAARQYLSWQPAMENQWRPSSRWRSTFITTEQITRRAAPCRCLHSPRPSRRSCTTSSSACSTCSIYRSISHTLCFLEFTEVVSR